MLSMFKKYFNKEKLSEEKQIPSEVTIDKVTIDKVTYELMLQAFRNILSSLYDINSIKEQKIESFFDLQDIIYELSDLESHIEDLESLYKHFKSYLK